MLAVVEKQQGALRAQVVLENFERRAMPLRVFTQLEDREQRLRDERRIGQRGELHEPDPAREQAQQLCSHLESQACLSRAAGACQRDQTLFCNQLLELVDLFLASNEGGQLRRQVMVEGLQRLERRKFRRQVGDCQLIELLRVEDILQGALPHIDQLRLRGKMITRKLVCDP